MSEYAEELRGLVSAAFSEPGATASYVQATAAWAQLTGLGVHRIGIDESRGGSGGSLDDLLVVVDALAERGVGVPVIEANTADWVRSRAGAQVLDGRSATLVLGEAVTAEAACVTAELASVPWARASRLLLLVGESTALVDLGHPSVTVRERANLAGEPRDVVTLDDVPVRHLPDAPTAEAVRTRLALLWSAALTGAARGTYRLTKGYVAEREQFGAPLLKLPAVAEGLASMNVQLLQAEAALAHARRSPGSVPAAAVARITTAQAATGIAHLAHQLHGAMGTTEEYPLHHLTRRLWSWRDAVAAERDWAAGLGRAAARAGEAGVWTELTATGA